MISYFSLQLNFQILVVTLLRSFKIYFFHFYQLFAFGGYRIEVVEPLENCIFKFFFFTSTNFLHLGGYHSEVVEPLENCIFKFLFHFDRLFAFGGLPY